MNLSTFLPLIFILSHSLYAVEAISIPKVPTSRDINKTLNSPKGGCEHCKEDSSPLLPALKTKSGDYEKDMDIFEKVAKKLIKPSIPFVFIRTTDDDGHVEYNYDKKRFEVFIGQLSYENKYKTQEGALAYACHELGHVAMSNKDYVSSEEEADYWASKVCLPAMLKEIKIADVSNVISPFDDDFMKACQKLKKETEKRICYHSLRGALFFRIDAAPKWPTLKYYREIMFSSSLKELSQTKFCKEKGPRIEQCAFNNLVAGSLQLAKPSCEEMLLSSDYYSEDGSLKDQSLPKILGVECL